jgi:uncharacterized repeat protein (TIGR03803 family)
MCLSGCCRRQRERSSDDGEVPNGLLVGNGVVYGTTFSGGPNGTGIVFSLTPLLNFGGTRTEAVLYAFPESHGDPQAGVAPTFGSATNK